MMSGKSSGLDSIARREYIPFRPAARCRRPLARTCARLDPVQENEVSKLIQRHVHIPNYTVCAYMGVQSYIHSVYACSTLWLS
jgi:hypothetical protein